MPAQNPRRLRLSYAWLHSARATLGFTSRPGALPYSTASTGPPAFCHAVKPPGICATFFSPISWAISTARVDRSPAAQKAEPCCFLPSPQVDRWIDSIDQNAHTGRGSNWGLSRGDAARFLPGYQQIGNQPMAIQRGFHRPLERGRGVAQTFSDRVSGFRALLRPSLPGWQGLDCS